MEIPSHETAQERSVRARTRELLATDEPRAASGPRRGREIVLLRRNGFRLSEIADRYGVSRERVRQILRANDGPAARDAIEARRKRH